uniref:Uncharacterized protein n=1 Tax=Haemonchus contortus TaxID=6289 RepID=A0A7I4YLI3_HAECO
MSLQKKQLLLNIALYEWHHGNPQSEFNRTKCVRPSHQWLARLKEDDLQRFRDQPWKGPSEIVHLNALVAVDEDSELEYVRSSSPSSFSLATKRADSIDSKCL